MSPRDGAATRERILKSAFTEFSKRGFAGARVDEIANRAGCNKALLYQHYGDKEALFHCVLEERMKGMISEAHSDPSKLIELAGEFFDFHAANRQHVRLSQWEALDFGTKAVPNEAVRTQHMQEHVARLERAQEAGVMDAKLDARHTLASMIGMVTFWFAFPQLARMIAGGDPYSPEALKTRRAHVVDIARRILEAR
jgi:AcrR family transcriptional regulator